MFTFHQGTNRLPNEIVVFNGDGEPITAGQRESLVGLLNRLGGLDPDDAMWSDMREAGDLRVAEMLENNTEPREATSPLRRLGGAVIRRLSAEKAGRVVHAEPSI